MRKTHHMNLSAKQKRASQKTRLITSTLPLRRQILNKKDNGKRFNSGNRANEKRRKT
jgi:hypothetical protein